MRAWRPFIDTSEGRPGSTLHANSDLRQVDNDRRQGNLKSTPQMQSRVERQ